MRFVLDVRWTTAEDKKIMRKMQTTRQKLVTLVTQVRERTIVTCLEACPDAVVGGRSPAIPGGRERTVNALASSWINFYTNENTLQNLVTLVTELITDH